MTENGQQPDSVELKTPFFSGKIAGKNLTLRDIVLLLVFGAVIAVYMAISAHAGGDSKVVEAIKEGNAALLKEIKDANRQNTDSNRHAAFHQCRSACLLEQPQAKRDGASCDRICANLRP